MLLLLLLDFRNVRVVRLENGGHLVIGHARNRAYPTDVELAMSRPDVSATLCILERRCRLSVRHASRIAHARRPAFLAAKGQRKIHSVSIRVRKQCVTPVANRFAAIVIGAPLLSRGVAARDRGPQRSIPLQ